MCHALLSTQILAYLNIGHYESFAIKFNFTFKWLWWVGEQEASVLLIVICLTCTSPCPWPLLLSVSPYIPPFALCDSSVIDQSYLVTQYQCLPTGGGPGAVSVCVCVRTWEDSKTGFLLILAKADSDSQNSKEMSLLKHLNPFTE